MPTTKTLKRQTTSPSTSRNNSKVSSRRAVNMAVGATKIVLDTVKDPEDFLKSAHRRGSRTTNQKYQEAANETRKTYRSTKRTAANMSQKSADNFKNAMQSLQQAAEDAPALLLSAINSVAAAGVELLKNVEKTTRPSVSQRRTTKTRTRRASQTVSSKTNTAKATATRKARAVSKGNTSQVPRKSETAPKRGRSVKSTTK